MQTPKADQSLNSAQESQPYLAALGAASWGQFLTDEIQRLPKLQRLAFVDKGDNALVNPIKPWRCEHWWRYRRWPENLRHG